MQSTIPFNAQMISWALARAGYNVQEFAEKYPAIHLNEWLQDKKQPTLKQLEHFSKKVHLPFGYLFLKEPPKELIPFPFFRTGKGNSDELSPNVYDTIQILQRRQDWLRDYLVDVEEASPLSFVGRFNSNADTSTIVTDIRKTLSLQKDWNTECPTKEAARKYLLTKIEEVGIIVVLNGVVENNTHRPIPHNECRGFAMVDSHAPFIFVNIADAPAAQLFTLVHELAHIWLGKSAGSDLANLLPANDPIELLCNKVAAEILVPELLFKERYLVTQDFGRLAAHFKVSRLVIARRALDLGLLSMGDYIQYYQELQADWEASPKGDGGNFYATAAGRVSKRFAGYVDKAVKKGDLLYRDAYRMTGLTEKTYQKFIDNL